MQLSELPPNVGAKEHILRFFPVFSVQQIKSHVLRALHDIFGDLHQFQRRAGSHAPYLPRMCSLFRRIFVYAHIDLVSPKQLLQPLYLPGLPLGHFLQLHLNHEGAETDGNAACKG